LHVHAENVLLEVLDEQGQPCQAGQTGRVHVTSLHNLRAPFIRYDLDDEATVGASSCPCGRGLPLLTHVQGKSRPMLRLADGRQKHSSSAVEVLYRVGGHWQYQLIQKAVDHLIVRLAINSSWTDQHAEQLRRSLEDFFEQPIRIDIEIHDRLPAPSSGKYQSVISFV
jgi:phenylacetate-CoA ligase